MSDGHMTAEEVERHLQSRQSIIGMVPERAPPTVPTEMFSNEPSLDRFFSLSFGSIFISQINFAISFVAANQMIN